MQTPRSTGIDEASDVPHPDARHNMQHFSDTFTLFTSGQRIVEELIASCGEFQHLTSARLPVLLSQRALVERGRAVAVAVVHGACYEGANSATRNLNAFLRAMFFLPLCEGHDPDFIILVDAGLWPSESAAAPDEREHLLYHALCHIEQRTSEFDVPKFGEDGRPMLRMRAHEIERFEAELTRYGSVIESFDAEAGAYSRARAAEAKRRIHVA